MKCRCRRCMKIFTPKESNRTTFCGRDCSFGYMGECRRFGNLEKTYMRLHRIATRTCADCGISIMFPRVRCGECNEMHLLRLKRSLYYDRYRVRRQVACGVCGKGVTAQGHTQLKYCTDCKPATRRIHKHVRRARIKGATTEAFSPWEIFRRDGWKCQICHRLVRTDVDPNHDLYPNLDHVIPLAKGGAHSRANTQCTCRKCNISKGDSLPREIHEDGVRGCESLDPGILTAAWASRIYVVKNQGVR
jgi:5-methylcytosine-specific restriction endonuclease McrA